MLLLLILLNTHSLSMGSDFASTPIINVQDWWPFSSLRIGDVICFKPSKEVAEHYAWWGHYGYRRITCHRIFAFSRHPITNERIAATWGDNRKTNPLPDFGYVSMNNYLGRVLWNLP